ncbi:MAG: NTP transferase domain-containing protein [Peptococcaceae bacterium]
MTKAIVLAGSSNNGRLQECSGETNEALIKIGNRCMVEYVVEALIQAQNVEEVIIAGPKEKLVRVFEQNIHIKVAESGTTIVQSLLNAVRLLDVNREDRILVVTSDIPLITGTIIDNFLVKASQEDADIIYPIVSETLNQEKFPGVKRTYVKLKEGIFTGGNVFLINPRIIGPCAKYAEELVKYRKSPFKLLQYIGFSYVFKYLLRRLSISDAQNRVGELFRIKGRAIIVSDPEIGVDVDKPSDLELVQRIIGKLA